MIMMVMDSTMEALIFIEILLADVPVFFLLAADFGVIILGTIRMHNIRSISTRISLMPVNGVS